MRKSIFGLTAAAAVAGFVSIAPAAQAETVKFGFGDLNLATPAGAAAFDARAEDATRRFCRQHDRQRVANLETRRACVAGVRAEIQEKLSTGQRQDLAMARQGMVSVATR